MTDVAAVVDAWLVSLPAEATFERVRHDFWYVRVPGTSRRWIPVEIDVRERTIKITSHVIVEPEENVAEVYAFLLRRNHAAKGAAFSLDGSEGVICLVARTPVEGFDGEKLEDLLGLIVQETEEVFRSILELGFGSRLRRRPKPQD